MSQKYIAVGVAKNRIGSPDSYHWGPWSTILGTLSFFIVLISVSQLLGEPELHEKWPLYVSVLSITWLATYLICSNAQFRTPYLITSAYIIPLCAFHLGLIIPYAFGWSEVSGLTSGTFAAWMERAGWYTVLALGCIGLGFSISLKRSNFKISKHIVAVSDSNKTLDILFSDGIGLLIASMIFLVMAIYSFGNLLNYSRVDFFRLNAGDTRGLGVFTMVLPIAVIFLAIGARKRVHKIIAYVLAALSFGVLLLSGSRSGALFPLLVGVVLWVKVGRRIPKPVAISALIFVLIAIPAIGLLRSSGESYNKIQEEDVIKSTENAKIGDGFSEMGSTGTVLANIIRLVPNHDPFRYGSSYLHALADSIPNIGLNQNYSDRLRAGQKTMTDPKAALDLIPSDWLTYRLDKAKFYAGEGLGFSGIGEPYINFGLIGVIGFFVFLGYFLGRLDSFNLLASPKMLVFTSIILWPLLPLVRNDFGNFTKPVVFTLIILLIWRTALKLLNGGRIYK